MHSNMWEILKNCHYTMWHKQQQLLPPVSLLFRYCDCIFLNLFVFFALLFQHWFHFDFLLSKLSNIKLCLQRVSTAIAFGGYHTLGPQRNQYGKPQRRVKCCCPLLQQGWSFPLPQLSTQGPQQPQQPQPHKAGLLSLNTRCHPPATRGW